MFQTATASLPLFFKTLVPFNSTEHAQLNLPKGPVGYAFAADTDVIPLLVSEVPHAIRHYPIVFIKDKTTSVLALVALVGRGDGKNRYVETDGRWRVGAYVPAWVRRYPFALMAGPDGQGLLALDTQAPMFADRQDGLRLVGHDGQPTEVLQKVIEFQKEFLGLAQLTEHVVQALQQADVLEEAGLSIRQAGSDKAVNVQGFMVVNERKLKALKSEQLESLFRADALGLAYAQMFSMNNLPQVLTDAGQ